MCIYALQIFIESEMLLFRPPVCFLSIQVSEVFVNTQNHKPPDCCEAAATDSASTAQHSGAGSCADAHQELTELWRPPQSVQVHGTAGVRRPSETCR